MNEILSGVVKPHTKHTIFFNTWFYTGKRSLSVIGAYKYTAAVNDIKLPETQWGELDITLQKMGVFFLILFVGTFNAFAEIHSNNDRPVFSYKLIQLPVSTSSIKNKFALQRIFRFICFSKK